MQRTIRFVKNTFFFLKFSIALFHSFFQFCSDLSGLAEAYYRWTCLIHLYQETLYMDISHGRAGLALTGHCVLVQPFVYGFLWSVLQDCKGTCTEFSAKLKP